MSFDTYANFKTALGNWLGRASDTVNFTPYVDDMVTLGEAEIWRRVRCREMEASANLTVSAQTVALPTRYVAMRRLYLDTSDKDFLSFVTPEVFWSTWASATSGQPRLFAIEGENLVFGPTPDGTYTGKILYYQRPTALSVSLPALFTNHPDLYFYAALMQAEKFMADDARVALWRECFERALAAVMMADRKDRYSGGSLQARPDTVAV